MGKRSQWGNAMSVHVSSWVWDHAECEGNELLIMLALADYANDEGVCWPGMATLSRRCRCHVSTIQRNIAKAVERGDMELTARSKDNGNADTNLYKFTKYVEHRNSHLGTGRKLRGGVVANCGEDWSQLEGGTGRTAMVCKPSVKEPSEEKKAQAARLPLANPELEHLFDQFIISRKKMRKPLTEYAQYLASKKLNEHTPEDAKIALENSIEGSWQKLYFSEDKAKSSNGHAIPQRGDGYTSAKMSTEEMYKRGLIS